MLSIFSLKVFIFYLFGCYDFNLEKQLCHTMAHFSVAWIYLAVSVGSRVDYWYARSEGTMELIFRNLKWLW